ncbi:arrestin [Metarhizium album ARSEF 1941]|uniref:Arrestin n=1 Tax=Metarhizium album (strain ARSEF 1941) TaxID=1081103 RepID=A0A0B2WYL9_METAS|nr:arrestin [Metarhizium album ARSEF 1941]KHN97945.1 arrestin [Metarhizium album ARSEF 1941]
MAAGTGAAALVGARATKHIVSQRLDIQIKIERHFNSKIYTSGSTISGQAVVKTQKDTRFDDFDIIFSGIAATRLDFVQQYPSHSFRPFMKLRMPIERSALPDNCVFEAGKTYTIPFNFVVPHHLTIGACNHYCSSPAVQEQHLRLPPTVGFWERADQAPDMVLIEYSVKARAYRAASEAGGTPQKIMEGYHILKVLPACPEDAPLDVTFRDERYNLSRTKTIRKKLFSVKAGKLTVTAAQPSAVMLSADGHHASDSVVRMNLEFAPTSTDFFPPKINSVSGKLVSSTFFGAAPSGLLPNLGSRATYTANPSLSYTVSNNIFNNKSVEKLVWRVHNVSRRRDSGYSSFGNADEEQSETECSDDALKKGKRCPIRHSAVMDVPFSIPITKKIFLPTFHSCLISRTYTLHLSMSVGVANTTMSLAIPLQIGVETIYEPQYGGLPSFESVMTADEGAVVGGQLDGRITQFPELMEHTDSMLPGYDEIGRRAVRVA